MCFPDGKKFNLEGSNGLQYCWHDLMKLLFSSKLRGLNNDIVFFLRFYWAGSFRKWKTANNYFTTLESFRPPFAYGFHGENFHFMQDGENVLTARNWHEWFRALDITILPWAGKYSNLNPLQNLWGVLARSVYKNEKQCYKVEELKDAIVECWNNLGQSLLDRSLS